MSDAQPPAANDSEQQEEKPPWGPLKRVQRRIVGVLVEKAKTTPDSYPLTLNALTTGCNQKSNRSPLMSLTPEQVEDELIELRRLGAVMEVQSGSRTAKFRHNLYNWFGIEKIELAIMAELLLRGEQTLGDLRARANRMDKIASQSDLKPLVKGLIDKGLIQELTPEGRGQIVTHCLYLENEMPKVIERASQVAAGAKSPASSSHAGSVPDEATEKRIEALEQQVASLTKDVDELKEKFKQLES